MSVPSLVKQFYKLRALGSSEAIKGTDVDFERYRGRVVLIVNVASKCGFTKQYAELQKLHLDYGERGLAIVGFPCNQFGSQEPGSDNEVVEFCSARFGVSFDLMAKIEVNGANEHPVYTFLKEKKSGFMGLTRIKWNFEKFLIDRAGEVRSRHSSMTSPESLRKEIEALLAEPAPAAAPPAAPPAPQPAV